MNTKIIEHGGIIKNKAGVNRVDKQADPDQQDAEGSVATRLYKQIRDSGLETFTHEDTAYAWIDGREVCPIRSKAFKDWVREFHLTHNRGATIATQALQTIVDTLDGIAARSGRVVPVYNRVAEHRDRYYLDLGDKTGRAVEISVQGWRIMDSCPVPFIRRKGMLALPEPVKGGRIKDLERFLNYGSQEGWTLLLAWLVAALRPMGPYPVLNLTGEQGCAKSTASRVLRRLIDPNVAEIRNIPTDQRDLMSAAKNAWTLAYDNITSIPEWMSNLFCILSTGGGSSTRTLYTDDEENLITVQRPIILNGIGDLNARPDLLDRTVVVTLPVIPNNRRQSEAELWAAFEEARPALLGALLDAMVEGLRNLPTVNLRERPRMADFAEWVTACEPGLDLEPGSFMRVYNSNQEDARRAALEAYPLAEFIREIVALSGTVKLPPQGLLNYLNNHRDATDEKRRHPLWPKDAARLSKSLTINAPTLRSVGVDVQLSKSGIRRVTIAPMNGDGIGDANTDGNTDGRPGNGDGSDGNTDGNAGVGHAWTDGRDGISGCDTPSSLLDVSKEKREERGGEQSPDLVSLLSHPSDKVYSSIERDQGEPANRRSEAPLCEKPLSGRAANTPGATPLTPTGSARTTDGSMFDDE